MNTASYTVLICLVFAAGAVFGACVAQAVRRRDREPTDHSHCVAVTWTCRHCDRRHVWNWPLADIVPGRIEMRCDECQQKTLVTMKADGACVAVAARRQP